MRSAERSDVAVYVLNMGQPVKIVDLAERMIRLAGLEPGRDVDIVFTGTRPGERIQEILFAREEPMVDMASSALSPPVPPNRPWKRCAMAGVARTRPHARRA